MPYRNLSRRKGLRRQAGSEQRGQPDIFLILKEIYKSGFMLLPSQVVTLPHYFPEKGDVCGFALRLLNKAAEEKHNSLEREVVFHLSAQPFCWKLCFQGMCFQSPEVLQMLLQFLLYRSVLCLFFL